MYGTHGGGQRFRRILRRDLVITTPASDLHLLTDTERRVAAGLEPDDASQDIELEARSLTVAANIVNECRIAVGRGADPTLKKETLTETFYGVHNEVLRLARRHNISIASLTVDGSVLPAMQYLVDPESGVLTQLSTDGINVLDWVASKIVVVYDAGLADPVPGDLKQAAKNYFNSITLELTHDPAVTSESVEVPGLETRRTDFGGKSLFPRSGATATPTTLPPGIGTMLTRYRNVLVA